MSQMEEKKRMGKNGYLALGIVSAIVALFLVPPCFRRCFDIFRHSAL